MQLGYFDKVFLASPETAYVQQTIFFISGG